jgi:hypothetical protein
MHRWAHTGVRGGIRLRTIRSGGRVFTTQEWVEEFLAQLNTTDDERLADDGC